MKLEPLNVLNNTWCWLVDSILLVFNVAFMLNGFAKSSFIGRTINVTRPAKINHVSANYAKF